MVVVCAGVPAQAAIWETHGPGQPIYALAIDPANPSTLYAGADMGNVFKSTDAGGSWMLANSGVADQTVRALVIDPTDSATVYAGTAGAGVYKTTDGGSSWNFASVGLASDVRALAINPITPSNLYAGVSGGGVYETVDGGTLWTPSSNGLSTLNVTAVAINPSNPSRVYAATLGGGVFITFNGGIMWTPVNDGVFETLPPDVRALAVAIDPSSPTGVSEYAGTVSKGVYKSTAGNGNWNNINAGLPFPTGLDVRAVAVDPVKPATLYAATAAGVFRMTDRDPSWVPVNGGLTNLDVAALAINPINPSAVYVAGSGGAFARTQLCSTLPLTGCRLSVQSGKSVLTLKDKTKNKKDTVLWKWLKGEALDITDYGNPVTSDDYSLCIYDESGSPRLLLGATAPAGRTCGKQPCWKTPTKKSFKYKNALRTDDGIDTTTLTAGTAGKAQTVVSLQGIGVLMPTLPLPMPLHVQLQSNGKCWDTHFSTVRKNLPDQFDARSD
jgi:photosystem II stability/assembly factor-like uncharacterized protein